MGLHGLLEGELFLPQDIINEQQKSVRNSINTCNNISLKPQNGTRIYRLYRLHPVVYKILDYLYYNRPHNTFLMYNLLVIYQYSYATCFDHDFGHHQALNEHI
jgi:hypothetical protein